MAQFAHEENPLDDFQWEQIKNTVVNVARRKLVGRRVVEVFGPLGPGVQTIVHDHFTGTTIGRVGLLGEQDSDPVRSVRRESGIIPLIYKDFIIHWRDIEASRYNKLPLDPAIASAAAAFCCDREDDLIFNGVPEMGYEGLMTVDGRHILKRRDWKDSGNAFADIVLAMETLINSGHYGPFALVTSPLLFSQLYRVNVDTNVLEITQIRELMTDGVYQSPLIREGYGVVLSTSAANFDLAVGQDLSVAYLGAENMNHPFRVFESVYLRIKRHNAICTLEPPEPAAPSEKSKK
ncbi:MAG TPA: family 1 encapsulin nanocompartment shell protein [Blastocatellia bacterium]|nr:family 1 encapsulin nanocompartment shell protein [Blastocatellia bacterium]